MSNQNSAQNVQDEDIERKEENNENLPIASPQNEVIDNPIQSVKSPVNPEKQPDEGTLNMFQEQEKQKQGDETENLGNAIPPEESMKSPSQFLNSPLNPDSKQDNPLVSEKETSDQNRSNSFPTERIEKSIKEKPPTDETDETVKPLFVPPLDLPQIQEIHHELDSQTKYELLMLPEVKEDPPKRQTDHSLLQDDVESESDLIELKEIESELKSFKLKQRLHKQKINGIYPGQLQVTDVTMSYFESNAAKFVQTGTGGKKSFLQSIIIHPKNKYYILFEGFVVLCSWASSYLYAYMAAFGDIENGHSLFTMMLCFEAVFLVSMALKFIVSFTKDGQTIPTTDIKQIAERYIKGTFIFELIPLIPFQEISNLGGFEKSLYLIKCVRMINGFRVLNIRKFMIDIRHINQNRLDRIIASDPQKAEDTICDENKITQIIFTGFFIKIFKLGLIIINLCYFLGLIWHIICEISWDRQKGVIASLSEDEFLKHNTENFLNHYGLEEGDPMRNTLIGMYFSLTTLSTVGFGDYTPRSDTERTFGALLLLIGVSVFSYLMGNFLDILGTYHDLNANFDDGNTLAKFFGVLKYYNDGEAINQDFKLRIEAHFDHIWNNDKNIAFTNPADEAILDQLPIEIQNKLYTDFLFVDFLSVFTRSYFRVPQENNDIVLTNILQFTSKKYYTWENQTYRELMISIIRVLEPRRVEPETVLYRIVEEVQELYFIIDGSIDIGFEISRETRYVVRLTKGGVIGIYNITFDRKTSFNYKVKHTFNGFCIRRNNWRKIIYNEQFEQINSYIRQMIEQEYIYTIKNRVQEVQIKSLGRLQQRQDKDQILSIVDTKTQMLYGFNTDQKIFEKTKTVVITEFKTYFTFIQNEKRLDAYTKQVFKMLQILKKKHEENKQLKEKIKDAIFQLYQMKQL